MVESYSDASILDVLNRLEIHDSGVVKIEIDFERGDFILVLDCLPDDIGFEKTAIIRFKGVKQIDLPNEIFEHYKFDEMYSLECIKIDNSYLASFHLLGPHSSPSLYVRVRFEWVEIDWPND